MALTDQQTSPEMKPDLGPWMDEVTATVKAHNGEVLTLYLVVFRDAENIFCLQGNVPSGTSIPFENIYFNDGDKEPIVTHSSLEHRCPAALFGTRGRVRFKTMGDQFKFSGVEISYGTEE